jgi:spermidine synthase
MQRRIWLAQNQSAIRQRLQGLPDQPEGIIFSKASGTHNVVVFKERSLLYLLLVEPGQPFPDIAQSRMNFKHPFFLVNRHEQAMLLSLLWQDQPRKVCVIGLGGGRIPLVLHHHLPHVQIECIDLDPVVIEAATQFFGVQADERLAIFLAEGRSYLSASDQYYDLIIIDAFLADEGTPYPLATQEFYQLCRSRLAPGGVVVANLLYNDPLYVARIKTMQTVFNQIYGCLLVEGNRVILGTMAETTPDEAELRQRAAVLQGHHQFSFPLIRRAIELQPGSLLSQVLPRWEEAAVLKDDSTFVG